MIKIRYKDLPGGLHARAEARGKDTIVYLLPGLTVPQRRAALRRLRGSARMGHAPPLPGPGLTRALVADKMRINGSNAVAALRMHPGLLAPPIVAIVLAAVAFVLLVPVPVRISSPQASGPAKAYSGMPPDVSGPPTGFPSGGLSLGPGRRSGHVSTDGRSQRGKGDPAPAGKPSPVPSGGVPTVSPFSSPSPSASPSPSPSRSPSLLPSRARRPGPRSGGSRSLGASLCVAFGHLSVCL